MIESGSVNASRNAAMGWFLIQPTTNSRTVSGKLSGDLFSTDKCSRKLLLSNRPRAWRTVLLNCVFKSRSEFTELKGTDQLAVGETTTCCVFHLCFAGSKSETEYGADEGIQAIEFPGHAKTATSQFRNSVAAQSIQIAVNSAARDHDRAHRIGRTTLCGDAGPGESLFGAIHAFADKGKRVRRSPARFHR